MAWINRKTPWLKEWELLEKKEARFLKKQEVVNPSLLTKKLQEVVPDQLQEKLNLAFGKAFHLVFVNGTPVIEKTYGKEKGEETYKVQEFAIGLRQSRKHIKACSKQAGKTKAKNLAVSGVEGIGLGFLGIGLPDIPLFTGMLLKSIYEIAINYGCKYDTQEERIFILRTIRASLEHGAILQELNQELDDMIVGEKDWSGDERIEVKKTADTLSRELLYMKFLQGIPIAGIIGGASDAIYLKQITDYASMKYQKRFLLNIRKN